MDRRMDRTVAEILAACDEEFGVEYRHEAEALADDLVVNYEVAAKHKAAPRAVPADRGPRGLSVTDLEGSDEYKPGSLDQVAADIAARRRAGTWRGLVDGDAEL
jgi:hypothetical protein